ncbi:hypothetical protein [Pseudolabrys sp. FHR47]|uniref:hypothetical protein n=1 Tax=Pseudolabrys sp. FHR47 TaxID=2562284 RepID=UPI0010BE79F3|nr:hypothetical protein [Pseudolabrys sp. FHR47]
MRRILAVALAGSIAAVAALPAAAQTPRGTEVAQASRQRIIITPGRAKPGPNSTRQCQARLVEQHRPSGTVIVPVMHCWWQ